MVAFNRVAEKEKTQAAMSSVIAAIGLTTFKIIVGIMTGSLGILAEAAHSGLDLVAALVTFLAVRLSGKPADPEHPYGHGKIENLSALFETILLLGTCVWIIYEAWQRLFFKNVVVESSIWSFLVMGTSIIIDITRSRVLYAAARKHNSQALEADALHFSTDVWSSSVVILGLVCVLVADLFPRMHLLQKADSIAALGVAVIVVYISMQLGGRTIQALLDSAPKGMAEKITATVEALPGIIDCHNVRVRYSGPHLFVDAHILVNGAETLEEAHTQTEAVEAAIRQIVPDSDVTVHAEPANGSTHGSETVQEIIAAVQSIPQVVDCHDVEIHSAGTRRYVIAHITVDGSQSLEAAHALTETIEQTIQTILPGAVVTIHPEPSQESQ